METIRLSMVIQSHLNDAVIEIKNNPTSTRNRTAMVRALLHYNQGVAIDSYYVTNEYLNFMWDLVVVGETHEGCCSYTVFKDLTDSYTIEEADCKK